MNDKCPKCGIVHNWNYCPNCGTPAQPPYQNGPYHFQPTKKKGMSAGAIVGITLAGVFAFFIFVIIIGILFSNISSSPDEKSMVKLKQTEFQIVTGTNAHQEADILEIFSECGITTIDSVEHDELLDDMNENGETGYRISYNGIDNIILYLKSDRTVNQIRYSDNGLYVDGSVVSTISDYTLTWDEQSDLQIRCQKTIKSILKSPSTAKFPNILKWVFWKEDGKIYIQSYVDSQNSFGAELRSEFQFVLSAGDNTVLSLIFDGEEMMSP